MDYARRIVSSQVASKQSSGNDWFGTVAKQVSNARPVAQRHNNRDRITVAMHLKDYVRLQLKLGARIMPIAIMGHTVL